MVWGYPRNATRFRHRLPLIPELTASVDLAIGIKCNARDAGKIAVQEPGIGKSHIQYFRRSVNGLNDGLLVSENPW